MNRIKEKLNKMWQWTKTKARWILISLGIVSVAIAAPLITPNPATIDKAQMEQAFAVSDIAQDYIMQGATFIKQAVDENSIKVKLGKDGIDEFTPDFYISRWEDEVYFKMKPRGLTQIKKEDKNLKLENKKIKFETPDVDYNMYEIDDLVNHPEGAYEYEVILKTKPISNVITFDIETNGLDFFYQPELTQEQIDNGAFRPENAIGSYAVYHSTKSNHIIGQKNYRVGKAFHIYRPQMEDANGWKVWGELDIDTVTKTLSVTIPQSFIDNAVYPLKHAIGATFGYTTCGVDYFNIFNGDDMWGTVATSDSAGTGDNIKFCGGGYYTNVKGILVLESNKNIVSNGIGDAVQDTDDGVWFTSTFSSSPSIIADTNYWVSLIADDQDFIRSDETIGVSNSYSDTSNSYASPEDPTDSTLNSEQRESIYVTYTAGGGATAEENKQDVIWFSK